MDRLVGTVPYDLYLDVARLLEILLDIDRIVPERGRSLGAGCCECDFEVVLAARHFHAAAATTGGGLDNDRVADFGRDAPGLLVIGYGALRTGHDRNPQSLGGALGFDLVAHDPDMVAGGA